MYSDTKRLLADALKDYRGTDEQHGALTKAFAETYPPDSKDTMTQLEHLDKRFSSTVASIDKSEPIITYSLDSIIDKAALMDWSGVVKRTPVRLVQARPGAKQRRQERKAKRKQAKKSRK